MGKSKWYNWLLNPVGALVNNITDGKNATARNINAIFNPAKGIKDGIDDIMARKKRERDKLSEIESEAAARGMSLDEFLQINPDKAAQYERLESPIDKVVSDIASNPHVESFIESITGERDTNENQKNRDFQHQEAELARDWEVEQAKAAREWDSIGAQMERASSAGVNPISIAMQSGGIGTSATTSIPSAPSAPSGSSGLMHNGLLDIAGMVFNGIGTLAENRLKQSQADDIVAMRGYNIAEKIANIDHLRELCAGQGLSNTAQSIQNRWLDIMNQATYDGMLLDQGVSRATILEKRSIAKVNLQTVSEIKQRMQIDMETFNKTLPLDLQLKEIEIDLTKRNAQEVYEEICLRHLQLIEQENRNKQSAAEAESAETASDLAKQTFEDAINSFHNSMVLGAAEAGIKLNDYMYYGATPVSVSQMPSQLINLFTNGRKHLSDGSLSDPNLRGISGSPDYQRRSH